MKTKEEIKRDLEFLVKNHGKECIFKRPGSFGRKVRDVLTGYDSEDPRPWRGRNDIYFSCEEIPEPKVIPWTARTCPDVFVVKLKTWSFNECLVVRKYGPEGACLEDGTKVICWKELLEKWEQRDGSPCGEKV